MPRDDLLNLVMFYAPMGRLEWAWRRPSSRIDDLWGSELPVWVAQQAEAAKFDAVFMADVLYSQVRGTVGPNPPSTGYEPFMTLSAIAARTKKIGLIATASTTFVRPDNVARYFAGLEWISGGRSGWNIVTSEAGQDHYGIDLPPGEERYRRADEHVRATKAVWEMQQAGPQGHPVLVQAGQSPTGRDFAAKHAEVIFTAQTDLEVAQDFYAEVKERAARYGRNPDRIRILPGLAPVVAETSACSRALEDDLSGFINMETGRSKLGVALQADLTGLDLDQPVPREHLVDPEKASTSQFGGSRYRNIYNMAVFEKMTVRRLITRNELSLGHGTASGTVIEVADHMEEWFQRRACDGFALTPVTVPEGVSSVCDRLVPELRRRGLTRTDYTGSTLRENLGLALPPAASTVTYT